jgi:hypothetical protein
MSAPVTERGRSAVRGRAATIPVQRALAEGAVAAPAAPADSTAGGARTGRRSAQQKAYARRDDRLRRAGGERPVRATAPVGRPQFVLMIMGLLAVGLVATLGLSTAAAADSYRLQDATAEARVLSEQAERLHREVAVLASAPELARRAGELGMTPVRDPARLVVAPDGSVGVVGEPRAAVAPPPPVPPVPPAPPGGEQAGTEGEPPAGTDAEGNGTEGNGTDENGTEGDGTDENGTDENGTDGNGTDEDGTTQLALPGGDSAAPSVDGADPGPDAERRSGRERGAADGVSESGPATAPGRGGGTDAG